MGKTISIIVSAAALLAALTVFVCYDPKTETVGEGADEKKGFSNPLDKDGDNYLYGKKYEPEDEKHCTGVNKDGVALIFTDDPKCNPPCDPVIPMIALVSQSETIGSHEPAKFRKWMHFDGGSWDNLITYGKGEGGSINPVPREPCMKEGGGCKSFTEAEKNAVPKAGTYVIQYRVIKVATNGDTVCNGKIPQNLKEMTLICTTYVAPDTATPVITLLGDKDAEFRVGTTYTDRGVTVSVGTVDSIRVKGTNSGNTYNEKFTSVAAIVIKDPKAGNTYTITYYASYKGKAATPVVRNVKVIAEPTSDVPAIIILANYKHKLNGKDVYYPDTILNVGAKDGDYNEKGVEKVYYMKDGKEEVLQNSLVTITKPTGSAPPNSFINGQGAGSRTVNYDIDGASGYAKKNVKRNVFLVDRDCENGNTEPTVTKSGLDEIPADSLWDYNSSWSVTGKDELGNPAFKYLIDFNGLNPNKPAKGTYKITYVGMGKCGGTKELERTITVK